MIPHLLSLHDLTHAQFRDWLAVAMYLKHRRRNGISEQACAGRTLAMIFEKPSLRTRLSFEVAMHELGGTALYLKGDEVGLGQREAIQDAARVFGRYVSGIMARVFRHQTVQNLATHAGVPVINGLSDTDHPCQALADILTIHEHLALRPGLRVVFVGDSNNVCRSLAHACRLAGISLVVSSPTGYAFPIAEATALGITQFADPRQAAKGAHVLYTDVWTSMGQEAERGKRLSDFHGFQINDALLALADPTCRIMHCLPAHRDEEITDAMIEHPRSLVFDQAENRLHAQKALLRMMLGRDAAACLAAARGHLG